MQKRRNNEKSAHANVSSKILSMKFMQRGTTEDQTAVKPPPLQRKEIHIPATSASSDTATHPFNL